MALSQIAKLEKEKDEKPKDDLAEKLLETRTIVISGSVDSKLADKVITQFLLLEANKPDEEIKIFINSPGGEVYSGYAIFDMAEFITCPITTIVMGFAASMGSVLSLAGDEDRKFCLPNAKIMIHQPLLGSVQGQPTDLAIHAEQILETKRRIASLYSETTGKDVEIILKDMDRDHWLTSQEALEYGLIDKIVLERKDI